MSLQLDEPSLENTRWVNDWKDELAGAAMAGGVPVPVCSHSLVLQAEPAEWPHLGEGVDHAKHV